MPLVLRRCVVLCLDFLVPLFPLTHFYPPIYKWRNNAEAPSGSNILELAGFSSKVQHARLPG